jgi:hypothetical protein
MSATPAAPPPADTFPDPQRLHELQAFVARMEQRVHDYLAPRADREEQSDHLRHVADRTRWLYYGELQRTRPGAMVRIGTHDDALIQACAYSHDLGKWVPRPALQALVPPEEATLRARLAELRLTSNQVGLFIVAVRRRFGLTADGYTPEYDAAHHLVSAYQLVADESLGFHRLHADDQARLLTMIIGHQFGSYFKENLLQLALHGTTEVTTGMLMDVSRPDRAQADILAATFHDADISDLLFVGSLERRPNREPAFHTGGLVKILLINFTNRVYRVPSAPKDLPGCLRSCQGSVNSACKEFLTPTAVENGLQWRREARRFLGTLQEPPIFDRLNDLLLADVDPPVERLTTLRSLTRLQAYEFLARNEVTE